MSGANGSPTADIAPVIIPLYDDEEDDEDVALAEDHFLLVSNDAVSLEGECTSSNADIT